LVRARGLEPLILAEPDPKSGVSANSTTRAYSQFQVSSFKFQVQLRKFAISISSRAQLHVGKNSSSFTSWNFGTAPLSAFSPSSSASR
jgi:hypothetical protein